MKFVFSLQFFEKYLAYNFKKIRLVGAELFHADGRTTDRHEEAKSRFSQFCERA